MTSKGDETELVLDPEAQGQQHQELEYNDGVVVTDSQEASNFDYTGVPVAAVTGTADTGDVDPGASNPNENKWNKNGFGQGDATMRMRTGKYTKEETETIINAVKEYCAMKQITVARLCSECDHKADLKGSWMEIAKCLPNRPVQSVYRHGLRQLHPFKRGAWSDEEVEMLIGLVAQVGKKWAHIQAKLNRSADSCRDKYREIDDSFIRGRWKENETEQLKRLIREYLRVDPTADMKEVGKMVEAEEIKIPWSVISKRMGKRSRLSCFKKWQKMTGLYSPCDMHRIGASTNTTTTNAVEQHLHATSQLTTAPLSEAGPATDAKSHDHGDAMATLPSDHIVSGDVATTSMGTASAELKVPIPEEAGDTDVYLLSEIASLGVGKTSEINWEDFRMDNAEERWYELLEEWQSSVIDDQLLLLNTSEIAQQLLEQKTNARRAAETVEAVDLPTPFL